MNRWTSWLVNAIKLGATYYVSQAIEPRLQGFFQPLPLVAPELITLIISGLIVVIFVDLTVARPRLVFRWSEPYERTAFQPVIDVEPGSGRLVDLQVDLLGKSLLARWIRRVFRRTGVARAQVALGSSDALRLRPQQRTSRGATADPDGQTVSLPFPAQGTTWVTMTAEMTDQAPNLLNVEVNHIIDTTGYRSVLGRLVSKEHNVTTLRAIRTGGRGTP